MTTERDGHEHEVAVVVNDEGQYSLWPSDRPLPSGWQEAGFRGSRSECLRHIAEVWTDMRPMSLRRQVDDAAEVEDPKVETGG